MEFIITKVGLLLCLVLGYMIDFAHGHLDLGITVPFAAVICVYITLMEIASIIENACRINPDLMLYKLTEIFGNQKRSE